VVCRFANNAVDVDRGSSMKRDVVDSEESQVMRVTGEGRRSCCHNVHITTPPGQSALPLLIDRPSERGE